jgi:hypothetical protein
MLSSSSRRLSLLASRPLRAGGGGGKIPLPNYGAGHYLRTQQRQFLPLLLGGAATACAVGLVGISVIVLGDHLYCNYKDSQQLKQLKKEKEAAATVQATDTTAESEPGSEAEPGTSASTTTASTNSDTSTEPKK